MTEPTRIIETTDNRRFRIVADLGAQFECIEINRFGADKSVRTAIILKTRIIRRAA